MPGDKKVNVINFPEPDDWVRIDRLIAKRMKEEGFQEDAIQLVISRFNAFREKYIDRVFSLEILNLPPGADKAVKEAFRRLQSEIQEYSNAILMERISTEIALLRLED